MSEQMLENFYQSIQQNKMYYSGFYTSISILVIAGLLYYFDMAEDKNTMIAQMYISACVIFIGTAMLYDFFPAQEKSIYHMLLVGAAIAILCVPLLMTAITLLSNHEKLNMIPDDKSGLRPYILIISFTTMIPFLLYSFIAMKTSTNINGIIRRFSSLSSIKAIFYVLFFIIALVNLLGPFKLHEHVTYFLTEGFRN
jgi:hypothetical protein